MLLLLLLGKYEVSSLQKPLGVSLNLVWRDFLRHARLIRSICPFFQLVLVGLLVKPMHFPHFLNLVQINHETAFVGVVFLDTLSTEYCQMI